MSDSADGTDRPAPEQEPEWKRRRRLAAVFGDVLPESTTDDRDEESPRPDGDKDSWLRAQVPPHHGD